MTKRKRTHNDLQNITQNTKDLATRIPLETGGELGCFGRVSSSVPCSTNGTRLCLSHYIYTSFKQEVAFFKQSQISIQFVYYITYGHCKPCIMCNHDIGPERTKNAFLGCGSRKLIRGCSENRRKGVIYYFQIKINMHAVISHSIPFTI